jgi:hypothetical protein
MTSLGPLGNKQVRVEDWISLTPVGDVGTSAVNTVQVTSSAGATPDGSYFLVSGPENNAQEPNKAILRWHVWLDVSGSTADPLPGDSNQPGIRVVAPGGTDINDVAAAAASTINAFFNALNSQPIRASATTDTVTVLNAAAGPARVEDGVGSRGGVAASTGWTFASATPGVLPATVTFTIASSIEVAGATGASIQVLVPQITDSNQASSYSVAVDAEITTVEIPDVTGNIIASAAAGSFFTLYDTTGSPYSVWIAASDGAGSLATDPVGSGTAVPVIVVSSGMTGASVAPIVASVINALAAFSASATGSTVTITQAVTGSALDIIEGSIAGGFTITKVQEGGGDFTIDRSNRFANPDFDSETS